MSKKETCPVQECDITIINKFIECPECKFKACINCYKHFMLNENSSECMSCKKTWNDDFIDSMFPKTFRKKELKAHREDVMFETQEAMFPETLDYLTRQKEIEVITNKIAELNMLITKHKNDIYRLQNRNRPGFPLYEEEEEKKVFITRPCPNEKCQGYLNRNSKCSACNIIVCSDCEVIKENDEHVCDPNDVESVKLKVKTSKPCPKCSKLTFKIDGCSQVWCPPPCGTAWNFNTGALDKGPVHSPDYYDYMRKHNNGVVPPQNNFACANNILPDIWIMQRRIKFDDFNTLSEIHRFFVDLRNNVMYKYSENVVQNDFDRNLDLRIKFLTNSIDKEAFKKTLFSRNKKTNKHKTIYENLNMLYVVGVDIFYKIRNDGYPVDKKTGLIDISGAFNELDNIRKYYNEVIVKTKDRYDCKSCDVSKITTSWKFSY